MAKEGFLIIVVETGHCLVSTVLWERASVSIILWERASARDKENHET